MVTYSRKIRVINTLFEVESSYTKEQFPWKLRGNVIDDNGELRFDLRLFEHKSRYGRDYYSATERGIRFTLSDLSYIQASLSEQGRTFSDMLYAVYCSSIDLTFSFDLADGKVLKIKQMQIKGNRYVDVRKYYVHNETFELVPTGRGVKLSVNDVMELSNIERKVGNESILSQAINYITEYKTA